MAHPYLERPNDIDCETVSGHKRLNEPNNQNENKLRTLITTMTVEKTSLIAERKQPK